MKKLFLLTVATVGFISLSRAQCVPDLTITDPGIYPDVVTNLPQGYAGVFYDTDIQLRVIPDTTVMGITVDVVDITVDSIAGLPGGFSYECSPPSCVFPGGGNGCMRLSGTSGTAGTYDITVHVTLHGLIFGFIPVSQNSVITGYQVILNIPPPAPVAVFAASQNTLCENDEVTFTDQSSNSPDTWSWSFPGGTPATSSDPNPVVSYDSPGVYDVTLTVSNPGGSDVMTMSNFITVNAKPPAKISPVQTVSFCAGSNETLTANAGPGYTYQWYKYGNLLAGETNQTLGVSTAGLYKVKVTDPATGCTKRSGLRTVVVQTPPQVAIAASGPTTFCKEGSVQLVATTGAGNSVQWTKGGIDIPGATSNVYNAEVTGFYKARAISSIGCTKNSNGITVNVLPLPNAGITTSGPLAFCLGDSVVLSALPVTGNSYQWERDLNTITGAVGSDYTATIAGKYTVFIENTNGCSRRSGVKKVEIICREGAIVPTDAVHEFSVYPNPVDDALNIEFVVGGKSQIQIEIYDMSGHLLESLSDLPLKEGSYAMRVNMETYSPGVYLVKYSDRGVVKTSKILIQR